MTGGQPGQPGLPTASPAAARRAVLGLLRPRAALAAGTALVLLGATVAQLTVPPLLGRIVDAAVHLGSAGSGRRVVDLIALVMLLALVVRAVLAAAGAVLVARLGEGALTALRERVVERTLAIPLDEVERAGGGDLLARVSGDVQVISEAIRTALPVLIVSALDVALTVVGLSVLDWRLALAGLVPLPVWVFATRWYLRTSAPLYAAERVAEGRRTQALLVAISGAATLRAYRLGRRQLAEVDERSREAVRRSTTAMTAISRFSSMLNGAELVGVVSILVTGFLLVRSGSVTLGAATAAALYFLRLFDPVGQLLYLLDQAQAATAALARLVGVAELPAPAPPARPQTPVDASVTVRGLRYAYHDGPEVLHGIELRVCPGERLAVVGPSGAGKTTMGALLAGVHRPVAGEVLLGGVPLADVQPDRLRRHVALVTQEVHTFAGSVLDNLRLARPEASDAELAAALDQVGALDWMLRLPDGLHTVVGEDGRELDATRAQQLALARLVLADPAVAVLDEATAEAGSAGARTLEAAADAALAGRTAIVIAHRLTQAVSADRIVVLDKGRVVETGSHQELVAAGGSYAILWAAWAAPR